MSKSAKWILLGVIVLFIIGIILFPKLKNKLSASQQEAPPVTATVSPRNQVLNINAEVLTHQTLTDKTTVLGSTIPDEEVNLSFESSGKIVAIYFTEGTHAKEGDLLAKINDKPLQAQLRKLEAQVPLARDRVYRQHTLLERDAVSQEAYEQVTTEYEKLMADIDLVKANIAQTELRAPFDGIIGLRSVSEGAYVTPSTMIAKLTKIMPLKIEFSVNEKYDTEIRKGTDIKFSIMNSEDRYMDYQAKVYAVESKITQDTRSLIARAIYPNPNEHITPGRFVSIEVTKEAIENALAIPSEAVIPEMGKNIVYRYKGGVAQAAEILIGLRTEERVQVLEGLSVGDTLITTGVMQLRSGMKVTIDNLY
ncbi:membrane fusion protein (multidrug efflux system) [Parabacteroides sp. PFB2-10]|uniref:efflux RND transporter periplasmic adaptor subunit n=1 Tax=Parabacteroides sp. PFB2-10 TaxID=1742405 RepID=UPI002473021E|nr:efflux RND transporter periplasmic adaptor subunit [Parabacteroides sp. PFB2-10]MDH6313234.1 membrane fusion protein (multidrug efflux system) [Parabacteroides sp. PFB2-10]